MGHRADQVAAEGLGVLADRLAEEEALGVVVDHPEEVVRPTDREEITARSTSTSRGWTRCSR